MSINTQNVKLGPCNVFFGGVDLGATKGGVEVEVKSETHKVMIDQFGNIPIKEYITSRNCMIKVPLAETSLDYIARALPGATLYATGGTKATGTVTLGTNPTNDQTVVINGVTVTFKTVATNGLEVEIGASSNATATNLYNVLTSTPEPLFGVATYAVATNVVTITYGIVGTVGNAYTLAAGTSGATLSGATLTGGVNATRKKVTVPHGTGIDMLSIAKKLVLHPVGLASSDRSEDFIVPLAASPGAMTFAYQLDTERVFNVEFTAFPDSITGVLFVVGDEAAT